MRRVRWFVVLSALVLACGKGTEPTPTVAGQWSGTFVPQGMSISLTMTLRRQVRSSPAMRTWPSLAGESQKP